MEGEWKGRREGRKNIEGWKVGGKEWIMSSGNK